MAAPPGTDDGNRRRSPWIIGVVALVLVVAGVIAAVLATRDDSGSSPPDLPAARWTHQVVRTAPKALDRVRVAAHGEDIVVFGIAADGTATSYRAHGDGSFVRGTPLPTGVDGLGYAGLWSAWRDGAWTAIALGGPAPGSDRLTAVTFTSDDGLTWNRQEGTGPTRLASLGDFTTTDGGFVLVGVHQHDPATSGSVARGQAWWRTDGLDWHEVELPVPDDLPTLEPGEEGGAATVDATAVATVGDTTIATGLAVGASSRAHPEPSARAIAWRSTDNGHTWKIAPNAPGDDGIRISSLVASGDTLVASGVTAAGGVQPVAGDGRQVILRSTDHGTTWDRTIIDEIRPGTLGGLDQLVTGNDRLFAISTNAFAERSGAACIDTDLRCDQTTSRIFTSSDGTRWWLVDRPDLTSPGQWTGDALAVTDSGRLSSFAISDSGFSVQSWPGGRPLPTVPPPTGTEPVEPTTTTH